MKQVQVRVDSDVVISISRQYYCYDYIDLIRSLNLAIHSF